MSLKKLQQFVAAYNNAWAEGGTYADVARQLRITRKECVRLAYLIRKAEAVEKAAESCLRGRLGKKAMVRRFVRDSLVTKSTM